MKRATRRIIFYTFLFLFVGITPFVILYSIGFVPDIVGWRLAPTGGFFVKTSQTGISVFIDGKLVSQTSFLSRGVLVNNLRPGLIGVEVAKDGFSRWRKSIQIDEQVIQEFPAVLLVPNELPTTTITAAPITLKANPIPKLLQPNQSGNALLFEVNDDQRTVLRVISSANGRDLLSPLIFGQNELLSAGWTGNGNSLLLYRRLKDVDRWDLISLPNGGLKPLITAQTSFSVSATSTLDTSVKISILKGARIRRVEVNPQNDAEFYLFDGDNVFLWTQSATNTTLILASIYDFKPLQDKVVYITKSGFLTASDLAGKNVETLGRPGFFIGDKPFHVSENNNNQITILDSAGGLYLEDINTNTLIPIEGNVTTAIFSPDDTALAYTTGGELRLLFLEDEKRQPFQKRGATKNVIDAVTPIDNFIWFNKKYSHAVFTTKNGIFITETDSRFGANTISLEAGRYLIAEVPDDPNSFYFTDGKTVRMATIK